MFRKYNHGLLKLHVGSNVHDCKGGDNGDVKNVS